MSSPVAELVGEFDHGLEGGRWSPDGEVLALFTYVDDDDDDEYDNDEYDDNDGDENKGSDDGNSGGGRKRPMLMTMNARFEVLSEVSVEPNVPSSPSSSSSPSLSRNVSLLWRPGGSAVVLSTVDTSDLVRRIRTYSRLDLSTLSISRAEGGGGGGIKGLLSGGGAAWLNENFSNLVDAIQRKGKIRGAPNSVFFFKRTG